MSGNRLGFKSRKGVATGTKKLGQGPHHEIDEFEGRRKVPIPVASSDEADRGEPLLEEALSPKREETLSDEDIKFLEGFDMDVTYGPCIGIPRSVRYHRAVKLGLNPPQHVIELIEKYSKDKVEIDLWFDRI